MTLFQPRIINGFLSLLILTTISYAKSTESCHPAIDPAQPQFIVGYGSLMQEQSKREDALNVGDNYPFVPKIDTLIATALPQYFKQIKIE
jgi:hypothetical protein